MAHVDGHAKPHIFRSYDQAPPATGTRHPNTLGTSGATEYHDIREATSAVPLYFEPVAPVKGKFGDGSLDYPNPSVEAFFEVNDMHKAYLKGKDANNQSKGEPQGTRNGVAFFLSIGAGSSATIPTGLEDPETKVRETNPYLTENSHAHMLRMTNQKSPYQSTPYYRLNVSGKDIQGIAFDEWKVTGDGNETLRTIEAITEGYLGQAGVDEHLHKLAEHLVRLRRKKL